MAKVRKSYNPLKQLTRVADHLTKNVLVGYTSSLAGCVIIHRQQLRLIPPESREGKQVIAALGRPHQWSCTLAVFGRTALGQEYMKSEAIVTSSRYYQSDLAPTFEEYHAKLIPKIPEHQRVAVGWLASPAGVELTEKEAGDLFTALQAWNDECPTLAKSIEPLSDGSMSI